MALNARISALTDELVQSIVKFSPEANARAYKQARDFALRTLKGHRYGRTNQFDVQASFAGLDEKFRILNRDDLADALKERLGELNQKPGKFTPDFLELLLKLSDRPVENSDLDALDALKPPASPPPLTWAEIIAEDPPSDEDLWKNIDYGDASSEDETPLKRKERTPKAKRPPTPAPDEESPFDAESCVVPVDEGITTEIEQAQFWKRDSLEDQETVGITELQAMRETLFMLLGLPTSLYTIDAQSGYIRVHQKFALGHVLPTTANSLLSQLTDIGRQLNQLRRWPGRKSSLPLIQTFEAAVARRRDEHDRYLSSLQKRYLVGDSPTSVSLLELHSEVRRATKPLRQLAGLISDIEPLLYVNPFAHLEALFKRIALAQMSLDEETFNFLGRIFFECLQTYLKPIRRWMELGELGANDETFFVFEGDSGSENSSLWHDRFVLRRGQENALRSPEFLQPAAQKIFNTGKSVVFLKELGFKDISPARQFEPRLDFESVCGAGSDLPLAPFSELFAAAFEKWIRSKYSLASSVLHSRILSECGLLRVVDVLKHLYLGADGSIFQDFASAIFERMDSRRRGWNDRYLLTELAHEIYGPLLDPKDVANIVVRTGSGKDIRSVKGLRSITLDYALPWSVMNIIQRPSIPIYQQVFTLLLQTYRTKYLLQRVTWGALSSIEDPRLIQLSYKLRHRLLWFVDAFRTYLADSVFARSTEDMVSQLKEAEDIDEMSAVHIKYVAKLQERSLLTSNLKPIHQAIISIMDLGILYADIHSLERHKGACVAEKPKSSKRSLGRQRSAMPILVDDVSSESENENGDDADTVENSKDGSGFSEKLTMIDDQFDRLLHFVVAGLRNVSRAGSEPCWEMLAERLEWNKPRERYEII